jgi:hypothetical protein
VPARYILTRALTGMARVQHTSTSVVLCFFLPSDGTRISSTYRLFTFSGSKSSMPLTLLLIACPHPSDNVTASAPAGFVSSKGQTSLQGIRSLTLRSC